MVTKHSLDSTTLGALRPLASLLVAVACSTTQGPVERAPTPSAASTAPAASTIPATPDAPSSEPPPEATSSSPLPTGVEACALEKALNVAFVSCDAPRLEAVAALESAALLGTVDGTVLRYFEASGERKSVLAGVRELQDLAVSGARAFVLDRGVPIPHGCQPNDPICPDLMEVKRRTGKLFEIRESGQATRHFVRQARLDAPISMVVSGNNVFVVEARGDRRAIVRLGPGGYRVVAEYGLEQLELAADEHHLYFAVGEAGDLHRVSVAGGPIEHLEHLGPVRALFTLGRFLYIVSGEYGSVARVERRPTSATNDARFEAVFEVNDFSDAYADVHGALITTPSAIYSVPADEGPARRIAHAAPNCPARQFTRAAANAKSYFAITRSGCLVGGKRAAP